MALNNNLENKQNYQSWYRSIPIQIAITLWLYCFIINVIFLLVMLFARLNWLWFLAFNVAASTNFICYLILIQAAKWLFSGVLIKQVCAYFTFFLRLLLYVIPLILIVFFANTMIITFSIVVGYSSSAVATIVSEVLFYKVRTENVKVNKERIEV